MGGWMGVEGSLRIVLVLALIVGLKSESKSKTRTRMGVTPHIICPGSSASSRETSSTT
jgi:hypothetical protein